MAEKTFNQNNGEQKFLENRRADYPSPLQSPHKIGGQVRYLRHKYVA